MKTRMHIGIIALSAFSLCASAFGQASRTWSDSTGKFKINATFVAVEDGKVKLKRTDGTSVSLPLTRLSAADQAYVRTLADAPAPGTPESPRASAPDSEFKKSVTARWSKTVSFSDNKKQPTALEVVVELKGEAAAAAMAYGMLEVSEATAGGTPLKIKPAIVSFDDLTKKMLPIDHSRSGFLSEHPKDGVRAVFVFKNPGMISKVDSFEGSLHVKTCTPATLSIGKVADLKNGALHRAELAEANVSVKVKKSEGGIELSWKGKHEAVGKVLIVDESGDPLPDLGQSSGFDGTTHTATFDGSEQQLDKGILQIVLFKDIQDHKVHVSAKDIPVAEK